MSLKLILKLYLEIKIVRIGGTRIEAWKGFPKARRRFAGKSNSASSRAFTIKGDTLWSGSARVFPPGDCLQPLTHTSCVAFGQRTNNGV